MVCVRADVSDRNTDSLNKKECDGRFAVPLRGVGVDAETRCHHYQTAKDVIAIKFACCETYYPCFQCHEAIADHEPTQWPCDRCTEPAVLCGSCRTELTVTEYFDAAHQCPHCDSDFNPGCYSHRSLYFERHE